MNETSLTRVGESYGNFKLIEHTYIDELQLTLLQLIHIPTGAKVMHLENKDPENLFCLSFRTLPENSNGVAHILEHTVLCGSRKYPVKDPFFSMSRRSLNTFMNAMTGSDFTCYPASSQVEADFYNLLEVYLDAVFHPLLKEMSFLQEGHYLGFQKTDDPSTPLEFKGIVYNEMKGAMSSVESRIWQEISRALTPDLPYAHNSGGDPKIIPSLTYEQLINFHESNYHPSRCLFFFYGNFPLKKHLNFIEEHALQKTQRLPPLTDIPKQPRFSSPIIEKHRYPTVEKKKLDESHIHTISFLTTPLQNQHDLLALSVLDIALMDTDASRLKKALLDTGLCISVDCFLDTEMTEVPMVFIFRGCREDTESKLYETLLSEFQKITKEGLPFSIIESAIHQLEFARTEIGGDHSPFGLTLFMRSAIAKQHGCLPENTLRIHSIFKELLEKAHNPYFFSPLIEKYILNNTHSARLSFSPDPQLASREAKEEEMRLKKIRSSLNSLDIAAIIEQNRKLEDFQKLQEGKKLNCLPKITLKDVPEETRYFPIKSYRTHQIEIHHHETFTNHVLNADVVWDLPKLSHQELFDLQLLLILWTELGVADRDYVKNLEFIQAYTGGISAHVSLHIQAEDPNRMRPSLQLHGKALERNSQKLFQLFQEMLTKSRFDETKRIQELIKKLSNSMKNRLSQNAMRYATLLALQSFSMPSYINELWYGLNFYNNLESLQAEVEINPASFVKRISDLSKKLLSFQSPNLVLSCDASGFNKLDSAGFYGLPEIVPKHSSLWHVDGFPPEKKDQARVIASPVAFTAYAFKTISLKHQDAAALQIATYLMENKILHHRIREQGGAYGSGAHYNPLWGNFYLHAYRDPHISHTYHSFRDAVSEIAESQFDAQDLEEAKLGIIQALDSPTSPGSRGIATYVMERDGKTRQIRQTYRDQLLSLEKNEISQAVSKHLLSKLDDGVLVTFACQELLDKELPKIKDRVVEVKSVVETD